MPQEYTQGFSSSDWLTIIGIVIGVAIQSWAFFKWQTSQFQKRDEAREAETKERHEQVDSVRDRIVALRDEVSLSLSRIDRDLSTTRHEFSVALAALPSRESMESMFAARVGPIEQDLRALVIELARNGMPVRREK